jgi:hypothetical protein
MREVPLQGLTEYPYPPSYPVSATRLWGYNPIRKVTPVILHGVVSSDCIPEWRLSHFRKVLDPLGGLTYKTIHPPRTLP